MSLVYAAFDTTVESDVELPLLDQAITPDRANGIRVIVDDTPISPSGSPIGGGEALAVSMYRHGSSTLLALNSAGWIAQLTPGSREVRLCPDARDTERKRTNDSVASRILGDRVVTSVLPYLPSTWGDFGVHGSLMSHSGVTVLLLGESGFGKSTISQYLKRDFGWDILDDDTSMMSGDDPFWFTPLGARARLREDATISLGLETSGLPGYSGRKGALEQSPRRAHDSTAVRVTTTIQLAPRGSRLGGEAHELAVSSLSPEQSVGCMFESLFTISPDDPASVGQQFQRAARWATTPHLLLRYDKSVHSAEETASILGQHLATTLL